MLESEYCTACPLAAAATVVKSQSRDDTSRQRKSRRRSSAPCALPFVEWAGLCDFVLAVDAPGSNVTVVLARATRYVSVSASVSAKMLLLLGFLFLLPLFFFCDAHVKDQKTERVCNVTVSYHTPV